MRHVRLRRIDKRRLILSWSQWIRLKGSCFPLEVPHVQASSDGEALVVPVMVDVGISISPHPSTHTLLFRKNFRVGGGEEERANQTQSGTLEISIEWKPSFRAGHFLKCLARNVRLVVNSSLESNPRLRDPKLRKALSTKTQNEFSTDYMFFFVSFVCVCCLFSFLPHPVPPSPPHTFWKYGGMGEGSGGGKGTNKCLGLIT